MRSRSTRVLAACAWIWGLAGFSSADSQFRIDVQPAIQGDVGTGGVLPLEVEIFNSGADAHGVLHVQTEYSKLSYPIELPRGADKRLIAYPEMDYGEISLSLVTDQGNVQRSFPLDMPRAEGLKVLLLGDVPGELSFLRDSHVSEGPPGSNGQFSLLECYVKPGSAPTRPVGYGQISSIILGIGAERLTDEAVDAIKTWVLEGHSLVFVGGASAPVLSDPRWAGLLPARDFHVTTLAHSSILTRLAASNAPSVSLMTGTPIEGATAREEDGKLVTAEKPFGLGRVTFLAFNPFEQPMSKWDGRKAVMTRLLRVTDTLAATSFISSFVGAPDSNRMGGTTVTYPATAGSFPPAMSKPGFSSIENDPFEAKLPETNSIFFILAAYFVVVVPVNFLVLKKLKRGELAWFTAPLISLGFAGILFASAGGLYKSKMSTVTNGLILGQEGLNDGLFAGTTDMFIPHGGSYDLKLTGVDSLNAIDSDPYMGFSRSTKQDMDAVDVGEIKIPNLVADNLSFRQISYRQHVPIGQWFHITLQTTGPESARCEVSNVGPFTLENGTIDAGEDTIPVGTLAPGERKSFNLTWKKNAIGIDFASNDVRAFVTRHHRAALVGSLQGFRPGPQLGDEVPGRTQLQFVLFSAYEVAPR